MPACLLWLTCLTGRITFKWLMSQFCMAILRKKITVVIKQGTLEGLCYETRLLKKPYARFLGIPYAKPPIDDLRFKPPVEHPGWLGTLRAFSEKNKCMQYTLMTNKIVGSEDCLYLNVFMPQEEPKEKKAVMVFIHGGAFNFGSGSLDEYSPHYLLDENVIVVTINYRLNVLGFLNFDIDDCPGNMGLEDQLLALKWVKANISEFGGDPNNITIFGESAGAASVHCHILSPSSKGLFQRAIMQSGSMFNTWALNLKHREEAFNFAKKLGCEEDDPTEIIKYLKNVSAVNLLEASKYEDENDFLRYKFLPTIQCNTVRNPFLPTHPENLVETAPSLPVINGVNNMEGLISLAGYRMPKIINLHKPEEIRKFLGHEYSEEAVNKVKTFYFNERNIENEITKLENICNLYTDRYFVKDFHRSFNHLLKRGDGTSVYYYEFKFDGNINVCKNLIFYSRPELRKSLKGACHADELNYLFYGTHFGFAPKDNSPEMRMCKIMSTLWSNFAKTGDPNSPSGLEFTWTNTTEDVPKYLSIDEDNTRMVDGLLYGSRVNFWEELSKSSSV
ncbi:Hypothetical protein CINCED_3A008558 [Cinara cedri]|uniref:Carboxylic ester hydrolase n=1 Tax=Cinara cedri TaxID=506608 RepID=A0A5E4MRU0_9HEMI|nr:Hypothetical protein CINCED_3A008558 [Cinara cedri]